MTDPYQLDRFSVAQQRDYQSALAEIAAGQKRSHWMWYVFPQYEGLGLSPTSIRYAIKSPAEARAYLAHPVLGSRLRECASALLALNGRSAHEIFATPDDLKLKSCMTLFAWISPPGSMFEQVIDKYFRGQLDQKTVALIQGESQ